MGKLTQKSGKQESHLTLDVSHEAASIRLDTFLASILPDLSRSQIKRLIDDGQVTSANNEQVKPGQKLTGGERLQVNLKAPETIEALPEELPLHILYEDKSVIVFDKPAGIVVHPAAGHYSGTIVNALLFHCKDLSGIGGKLRPGIVHRLDKDTSGVMMATKNDKAHVAIAAQFKEHSITRKYTALVYGKEKVQGTIDLPLGRHPVDRKKIAVAEGGKRAVTHWKRIESYAGVTLLELSLETGRTHQIRVHLSKTGHPIVGDQQYGSSKRSIEIPSPVIRRAVNSLKRQALHAYILGFTHPETGERMEFSSPLPEDIQSIIRLLEAHN